MMARMRKSKCMFSKSGIVLNEECTKVIGHVFCDIDAWSEGIACTPDGCNCYTKQKAEVRNEAVA